MKEVFEIVTLIFFFSTRKEKLIFENIFRIFHKNDLMLSISLYKNNFLKKKLNCLIAQIFYCNLFKEKNLYHETEIKLIYRKIFHCNLFRGKSIFILRKRN